MELHNILRMISRQHVEALLIIKCVKPTRVISTKELAPFFIFDEETPISLYVYFVMDLQNIVQNMFGLWTVGSLIIHHSSSSDSDNDHN